MRATIEPAAGQSAGSLSPPASARETRARWALILAAWAVPALLATFETVAFWRLAGRAYPAWRALATQLPGWLVYALLTPAIFILGRRLPLGGAHAARHLLIHLAAALAAGAVYAAVATAAGVAFSPVPRAGPVGRTFLSWYLSGLPLIVLAYFGVLGVGYAVAYLGESRRREVEAAQLAAQLAEARLGALRMQLQPHFLFNSLNAVTVLARDGELRGVVRMLTLLSGLLREVLRTDAAHEVTLAEEVEFVRRYLEVEQVRFSDRLRVAFEVDQAPIDAAVPRFLLQPLVENALRHGIAPLTAAGRLEVRARAVAGGAVLELSVRDDGVGLPPGWDLPTERGGAHGIGVGLSNTRARLAQLYGAAGQLMIQPAEGGGTQVAVRFPLRRVRREAPAGEVR